MAEDRLLRVGEVAERLRLDPETVRRWIRSGKLQAVKLGSNQAGYRVRESEVRRHAGTAFSEPPHA